MRKRKRAYLIKRDGERCAHCGRTDRLTIDHVVPRCVGGSHRVENLQLLCAECNEWKGCLQWSALEREIELAA